MVAAPQIGTPDALGALLHGDDQSIGYGGYILNGTTARSLAENMPTAYALLPSSAYFQNASDTVISFDEGAKKISGFSHYGSAITDKSTLSNFLLSNNDSRTKPPASDLNDPNILNSSSNSEGRSSFTL